MGYIPRTFHGGRVTTQKRNQAIIAASLAVPGFYILRSPTMALRTYGMIASRVAAAQEMAKAYPALRPDRKLAIEYGFSGDTVALAQAMPFLIAIYGNTPVMGLPVPDVGFGFTSVANSSSRLAWEGDKKSLSRGGGAYVF